MLLNELNQDALGQFNAASTLLNSAYGVKLSFTADLNKLYAGVKTAKAITENLRYQNRAIDDSEVSKYVLITEALQNLINHENSQRMPLTELDITSTTRFVIDSLVSAADGLMNIGDPFEDAIATGMKEYRSSKYRYDDVDIETEFRKRLIIKRGLETPKFTQITPQSAERSNLLDSMDFEAIAEAIDQMKAINKGLLTEDEVDYDNLNEIAEELIAEWDASDLKLVHDQETADRTKDNKKGVEVKFKQGKPLSPKDRAQVLRFKQQFSKSAT